MYRLAISTLILFTALTGGANVSSPDLRSQVLTNTAGSALAIVASKLPSPNKAGWNNTTVVVHFAVTNPASEVAWITPDVILSNEVAGAVVVGAASDLEGHSGTATAFVRIDKTAPTLSLEAGNGQVFDDSYPLLVMKYADKSAGGTDNPTSGLNRESFRTTLDGVQVTNLFYRLKNSALATIKHLSAGPHTWVASIADVAGNVTTISNTFTATGSINSNAPAMSNLDLLDDVTMIPSPSIWVQGKVSDQKSTVSALVNGDDLTQMNRLDDDFGFHLSMELGTNLILLVASDAKGQNRSARLVKVEYSEKFQLGVKSPEFTFGNFANGRSLPAKGIASYRFDANTQNELALAGVKVNGMAASLSRTNDDVVEWGGVTLPAPTCTNSIMPIIVSLCWTGRVSTGDDTNFWINVPVNFIEAYEIVQRKSSYSQFWLSGKHPSQSFEEGTACGKGQWVRRDYCFESENEFNRPCSAAENNSRSSFYESGWPCPWTCDNLEPDFEEIVDEPGFQRRRLERLSQSPRGLSFGYWAWQNKYTLHEMGDKVMFVDGFQVVEDGSLTFRTPFQLEAKYVDIFTFRGVEGAPLSNLTFEGNAPISWDETNRTVIYVLTLDGGTEYTISQDSFGWPTSGTNWSRECKDEVPNGKHLEWYSEEFHAVRFSDFNQ